MTVTRPRLAREAYHGVVGRIVNRLAPLTEADPPAILLALIIYCGWRIGRGREVRIGADRHGANEFLGLVGGTSKGRKGMATNLAREVIRAALRGTDADWVDAQQVSGLGSGEGLINAVRDPILKTNKDGKEFVSDPGVHDKRVLVEESEVALVFSSMRREGNTISARLREAWDGRTLQNTVKASPIRATEPHISMVAHITRLELIRLMTATEYANGFGNRFLWAYCARPRAIALPERIDFTEPLWTHDLAELRGGLDFGQVHPGVVTGWSTEATALYEELYPTIEIDAEDEEGDESRVTQLLARGAPHVVRLALIYATLDRSLTIEPGHLQGALACWNYCCDSVRYIFRDDALRPLGVEASGSMEAFPEGASILEALVLALTEFLSSSVPDNGHTAWTGTAEELHGAVSGLIEQGRFPHEQAKAMAGWPTNAAWLGRRLAESRASLTTRGVDVVGPQKTRHGNVWRLSLTRLTENASMPPLASTPNGRIPVPWSGRSDRCSQHGTLYTVLIDGSMYCRDCRGEDRNDG